jgi:vancomycin resistance protein YoaR
MATPLPRGGGASTFGAGVPRRIEQLVNAFARWVGYAPVAVDDQIDPVDATNVLAIQRWLLSTQAKDRAAAKAGLERLERELVQCAHTAELAEGQDGVDRTPEQIWVARHQQAIITKLPAVFTQLSRRGAR